MSNMVNMVFVVDAMDEQLIDLVQSKRFLYNKKSVQYKNNNAKVEAWKEIAGKLNSTEDFVKRRWSSLRDQFSRELRKSQMPSGSGAVTSKCNFKHMERMMFLVEAYKPRKTIANNLGYSTMSDVLFDEVSEGDDSSDLPPSGQSTSRNPQMSTLENDGMENDSSLNSTTGSAFDLEQSLSQFLEKASESMSSTDDLTYFFRYIEKIVRDANLSSHVKLGLQTSIVNLVMATINDT